MATPPAGLDLDSASGPPLTGRQHGGPAPAAPPEPLQAASTPQTTAAAATDGDAAAPTGVLERRLQRWPDWSLPAPLDRPGRQPPRWPGWFAGEWLVEGPTAIAAAGSPSPAVPTWRARFLADGRGGAVADRAFNARSLGQAVLGAQLLSVQDDPADSRRQLARLSGDRFLETTLIGQRGERPRPQLFLNDELSLQVLHEPAATRLSRIETIGRWRLQPDGSINGEQWQARYGSPEDGLRAGALAGEHLRLRLVPVPPGSDPAN